MKIGGIVVRRVEGRPGLLAGDVCQIVSVQKSGITDTLFAEVRLLRTGRVLPGTWQLDLFDPLETTRDT